MSGVEWSKVEKRGTERRFRAPPVYFSQFLYGVPIEVLGMFRGNHPARVDEKGRLKVPSEFKAALEAQGREGFITSREGQRAEIHSLKDWEQIEESLPKRAAGGAER